MKVFLEKFIGGVKGDTPGKLKGHDPVKRQVTALYSLLAELYGSDKLVLKAGKLDALKFMQLKTPPRDPFQRLRRQKPEPLDFNDWLKKPRIPCKP
jgi:hypothetical protein